MHFLVMLVLCAANLADFVTSLWRAPTIVRLIPEMLSVVVAGYILLEGVRTGFVGVAPKYWALFGCTLFIIVCGILTNDVGTGPIISGMRTYLRAIPLFLLPAVARFSETQVRQQIKCMLAIGLLQVPIACYQRWVIWSAGRFSGDDVKGTVGHSGILSIMLICIAVVLIGAYMRKRIRGLPFLALFLLVLLPTTINETKATVLLAPLGVLITVVVGSTHGKRMRTLFMGLALIVTFGAVLFPVYDLMNANKPGKYKDLDAFFTNEKQVDKYMSAGHAAAPGTTQQVGRGDTITVPIQYLMQDPVRLAFGLGIGNATHSNLGENFVGRYFQLFQSFTYTSFAIFLLEIGLLGTLLVLLLYPMIFFDAIAVARADSGAIGFLSVGWAGVVAVMGIGMFYAATHWFAPVSYPYWYFAGVIAARRRQLVLAGEGSRAARQRESLRPVTAAPRTAPRSGRIAAGAPNTPSRRAPGARPSARGS